MDSRRERDLAKVAQDAYIFAYPLLVASRSAVHVNRLFVWPGAPETLRICGWLDLGREPAVLAVPEIRGRYHVLWLRDAWNTAFASIGSRTTGSGARAFAVLGPGRHGDRIHPSLDRIAAPTRLVRVTGCIEATDAPDARGFAFRTGSLSRWTGPPGGAPATVVESPPRPDGDPVARVERLDAHSFFSEALRLSADNPPEPSDRAALEALAEVARDDPAVERGARRGRDAIRAAAALPAGELVGRWRVSYELGRYGTDYLRRAAAVRCGQAADPATDELPAVRDTDEDGRPLTGRDRYVLRFPADAPPPVNAFWSLTTGAGWIGDLHGLKLDYDGSLPIHIQHGAPEDVQGSNWLPAPPDRFSVVLRLYWPQEDALRRQWAPPAVTRVTSAS